AARRASGSASWSAGLTWPTFPVRSIWQASSLRWCSTRWSGPAASPSRPSKHRYRRFLSGSCCTSPGMAGRPTCGRCARCLACWKTLVGAGYLAVEDFVDFLAWLQRQLGRHLTAYDLVTFHHRGANYPDALLLDAVLKETCHLVERRPDLWLPHPQDPPERQ